MNVCGGCPASVCKASGDGLCNFLCYFFNRTGLRVFVSFERAEAAPLRTSLSVTRTLAFRISFSSLANDADCLCSWIEAFTRHFEYLMPKRTALNPRLTFSTRTTSATKGSGCRRHLVIVVGAPRLLLTKKEARQCRRSSFASTHEVAGPSAGLLITYLYRLPSCTRQWFGGVQKNTSFILFGRVFNFSFQS